MGKKTSTKASANPKPKTYTVVIKPFSPVAFAIPGIRKARPDDSVRFSNKTNGPIIIRMAASSVLKGLTLNRTMSVAAGKISEPIKVVAKSGTHEYSVHYEYEDRTAKKTRRGFAIGASSPKIIIVRPK